MLIPQRLKLFCSTTPQRQAWLEELPGVLDLLLRRWSITINRVFDSSNAQCSFVAAAVRHDGEPVVLKIGVPHFEAEHEISGLRFWDGEPTVLLLEADESWNAMLLEMCEPGTALRRLPGNEQDRIVADLLTRLWKIPHDSHPFRHLQEMVRFWSSETRDQHPQWPDEDLVEHGLQVFGEMARPDNRDVLLATDLHAGNVLRAQRKPWLVIDPKPFIGDPAYDATQHLLNRGIDAHARPLDLIRDFAALLGVSAERVRLWLFARTAAEPRDVWREDRIAFARRLRP